jgi:hypothetical protein
MEVTTVNNGELTVRTADGRFGPGNQGRKPDSRNKSSALICAINDCDPEALRSIVKQTVDAAKAGKVVGHSTYLRQAIPGAEGTKERTVSFELRHIATVADVAAALDDVLQGVANGELTPSEAASIADLIHSHADPVVKTEQARIMLEVKKQKKAA